MRAMILAAGLGTRLRPLTDLRAKPALPVCGRPVISLLLELLERHGCDEVMINLHHRPETIRAAVAADRPAGLDISWSEESIPLGTGGGIKRAADFLRQGQACVVLAGDMLLDVPLRKLFEQHMASARDVTLLLRRDERAEAFGSIGINREGHVVRIGKKNIRRDDRFQLAAGDAEVADGLFTGVRIFSSDALTSWPPASAGDGKTDSDREFAFEDLRDWLVPGIEKRGLQVGAEILTSASSVWEPVGTPAEYLAANMMPPNLPSLGGSVRHWAGSVEIRGTDHDVIVSTDASVPVDAELDHCVVWDGERVPSNFAGHSGIYAGGTFLTCPAVAEPNSGVA